MSKFYSRLSLLFLFLLGTNAVVHAQTPTYAYSIGTSNNIYPLQSASTNNMCQYIFTPSMFPSAPSGNFSKFYIMANANVTGGNFSNLTVKVGNTSLSSFPSGTWITGLTTVYSSPTTAYGNILAGGWFEIVLQNPFLYSAASNFIVEVSQTGYTGGGIQVRPDVTANGRIFGTVGSAAGSNGSGIINFGFDIVPASPCIAPPTAGTSVAAPTLACVGEPLLLNLTGNSQGLGQTYQWQSSPTAAFTTPTNVSGLLNSAYFTTSATGTLWYRAAVTCGTMTTYSTPVQVTTTSGFPGGTYTINAGAPVSATNFQSFTSAVAALTSNCGPAGPVVFNVVANSGPYNEQVKIPNMVSSSAVNTVTFNGNNNQLFFSSTNSNERSIITLDGADYITFNNLNLYASGTYGHGATLINDADNNTFNGCYIAVDSVIASSSYAGFVISGSAISPTTSNSMCDSNLINNCVISGGYYGFTMLGNSTSSQIYNNRIINSTIRNFYYYGLYVGGTDGLVVQGCTFSRPDRTSVSSYYGVYNTTGNVGLLLDGNKFTKPFGGVPSSTGAAYGLYSLANGTLAKPNVIQNNIFYDWRSQGTQYAIYGSGGNYTNYYHNTINLDEQVGGSCGCDTRAFYQTSNATAIEFKNNIFNVTRDGSSGNYAMYLAGANSPLIASNNVYYVTNPTAAYIGYYNSLDYNTLSSWQSATNKDANSVFANPIFANASAFNFTPTNTIDNLGTPVGTLKDILLATRSLSTPDVGAIEFVTPPCTSPPNAGTSLASTLSTCIGNQVLLSLTGNTVGTGQTYQWQIASSVTGPWTNIGPLGTLSAYSATIPSSSFFRAIVTCGTMRDTSTTLQITARTTMAGNYTINQNAAFSATNFQSFSDFAEALQCGITAPVFANVITGSGPYLEQAKFTNIPGTSTTNTVTILGNGNTISYSSNDLNNMATIKLENTHHLSINDLTIKATGISYGTGVHLYYDADSNTINGCTIDVGYNGTSSYFVAVAMSGSPSSTTLTGTPSDCDGNTFSNNTFIGGYYCFTAAGKASNNRSKNNKIINNEFRDFYYYGIYDYYQENLIVDGNEFHRPTRTSFSGGYALYMQYALNNQVSNNRIHDLYKQSTTYTGTFYGIYMGNSHGTSLANGTSFSNNLFYNLNWNGGFYGIYIIASNYATVFHNVVNVDNPAATTTAAIYSLYLSGTQTGLNISNNIFTTSRGGSSTKYMVYFGTTPTSYTMNKNVYWYAPNTIGTNNIGYYAGNQLTLSNWQSITGQEAGSVNRDPIYVNAAAGNLTPTNALVGNIGNPVGVTQDILGNTRSLTAPDPGAYEWPYTICQPPTNLVVSNLTGNSATFGWTPVAGAAGYEYKVDFFTTPPISAGTPTTGPTGAVTGLIGNTGYYLHVRTNCGNSLSTWVTIPFKTLCAVAPTVNPVAAITTSTANLSWSTVPGSLTYQYALTTVATPPASGTVTNGTSYNPTGLIPNTTYYFHVRSQCDVNNYSVWTTISFTTACPVTTNLSVNTVTATTANVSWQAVTGVLGYEYAVIPSATAPASGTFTVNTTVGVTGLTPITQYWLHVRVKCSNTNFSPWQTITFSTACVGTSAVITPAGPTTFCQGFGVILNANTGAGLGYQWNRDNSPIVGATASSYNATATGDYTVTVKYTPLCSITSASVRVSVLVNPPAIIEPTQSFICASAPLTLVANTGLGLTYQWQLNGTNITNATANTYNATAPGVYTVKVIKDSLCQSTSAALPLTLSNPLVAGTTPGSNCGTGTVQLGATASAGSTLRWFNVPVGGYPVGSGTSYTTPVLNSSKTYYVTAYDGFGQVGPLNPAAVGTASTNSSNIAYTRFNVLTPVRLLSVDIVPNVPSGTAATVEIRDSVGGIVATIPYQTTVNAGVTQTVPVNVFLRPGTNYRLMQGIPISLTSAFAGFNIYPYTSTAINIMGLTGATGSPNQYLGFYNWQWSTGCESPRVAVVATIDPGPGAVVSPNPASFCTGGSVTLTANASPSFTYQWTKDGIAIGGATSSTYAATAVGSYTVRVTTGNCGTTSAPVQVTSRTAPAPIVTVTNGSYLSTGVYATYQWKRNGVNVPNGTGQNHPAAYDGSYTVTVTDVNGCISTSEPVKVTSLSVKGSAMPKVVIHPNPATTVVNIDAPIPVIIRLTSMEGKVILTENKATSIDISRLPAGLYMIRVSDMDNNLLKVERFSKVD